MTPADIKQKLREVVGANPNHPIRGIVTATNGQTCSVKLISGLELPDVRLKVAISDSGDYMLITPKIGTDVLLISGDGTLDDLTILKADQVHKIEIKQGGLVVLFDSADNKVSIKNSEVSLKDIFTDQAALLKQLKVSTPQGPSGTPLPNTILAIEQWETKFNKLLK
ncbi:hypothetical protein [Flavobacterium cerinum]|uniref:Uncharacterized protein n=1 Tax=Flavobacterium cerinum TaxID=2502784 RepID=A0A3S3QLI4_9FLAO|nr:hypothetical protein [Flavobacterium cerinum]RWX00910.1 hypothetical protein EPI11_07770 [Flavobacterium cerinum]